MTARWIVIIALVVLVLAVLVHEEYEGELWGKIAIVVGWAAIAVIYRTVGQLDDERHFWFRCFTNTTIRDGIRHCVVIKR